MTMLAQDLKILVEVRTVYGIKRTYPVCENAKRLAMLTGRKTLSKGDLTVIRELGIEVEFRPVTI